MKSFVFFVRPWNVEFFLQLTKHLQEQFPEATFCYWTMQSPAVGLLQAAGKPVTFLPEAFAQAIHDRERVAVVDSLLAEKFGFGLPLLYEIERFKPPAAQADEFIGRQVCWLEDHLPQGATLISLTCEHFVYILAGFMNRLKDGLTIYSTPTGFPVNANAIKRSPWELHQVRAEPLTTAVMEEYRQSLSGDPRETIHYMKKRQGPNLRQRIQARFSRLFSSPQPEIDSIFNYIKPTQLSAADKRAKKRGIPVQLDYLSLVEIRQLAQQCRVFYFPLQLEPEMSILAYSPYFKDQREVARLISQCLSYEDIVVVKENPKMHGRRGAEFYHQLSQLPNLRWVDPEVNSREVIRAVYKVVATTGTATMEAAMLGRPSLIFGHPPFRTLLAQPPVCDLPLRDFRQQLYANPHADEITAALNQGWPEYSRALFFGDFVPRFVGGKRTTADTEALAERFYREAVMPCLSNS